MSFDLIYPPPCLLYPFPLSLFPYPPRVAFSLFLFPPPLSPLCFDQQLFFYLKIGFMNYKSVWLIKIHIFVSIVDMSVACLVSMIKISERRAEALLFGS